MPVFKQYTESSYKWGIWKASESLEELLALLPHKEKYEEGIGKFTAVSRKLEWLAVRVLLYTMLGEEKEIHYYSNGGPYLADGSFSISISHTKGYVAVLLSEPGKESGLILSVIASGYGKWRISSCVKMKKILIQRYGNLVVVASLVCKRNHV